MTDLIPPMPDPDIAQIHTALHQIYVRSCMLAEEHRTLAKEMGVPPSYWPWFSVVMSPGTSESVPTFELTESDIVWYQHDSDGDLSSMTVPLAVLLGQVSTREWAEQTHTTWQARRLSSEISCREARLQEYLRLKAEFENNTP